MEHYQVTKGYVMDVDMLDQIYLHNRWELVTVVPKHEISTTRYIHIFRRIIQEG